MIKKLLPYIGEYKKQAILSPVTVIIEVIIEVFIPFLMAKIIDVGIKNGDIPYMFKIGGVMIVLALMSMTFSALAGRFAAVAATGFASNLRKKLFYKVSEFSFANLDRIPTASLITRLTTDVTNTQMSFMLIIRILVRAPFMMIMATSMAIAINARLSIVFLTSVPILAAAMTLIILLAFPRFKQMLTRYDKLNSLVQENLQAIRVVKAFVREDHEISKFSQAAKELRNYQQKAEKLVALNMPLMSLAIYACIMAICWRGGNLIIAGGMQTGELFSFISYVIQILMALVMISMVLVNIVLSKASAERIIEVLDEKIDITDEEADASLQVEDGSIIMDNVSFSYSKNPDNLTLQNISLTINSGETVGIIGGTGSAKTTLVQLIPRLYDVYSGTVKVGGHDVRNYQLTTLRNACSMVLQKNLLFSGTIRDNLRWGNPHATEEQMKAACQTASADEFIQKFEGGYDYLIEQGGVNVSGGQRQRLCIARALLKNPKIIILDDSTSAVDVATDTKIRNALRKELKATTKIIIAQRLSSIIEADKIIVMNEGQINDIGTHEQLLARNEIYKDIYFSQQKGVS